MQELEKILEEIKEALEENKVIELNGDGTVNRCIIDAASAWDSIKAIIHDHMNDGWIPVEERTPEEPKANPQFEGKKIELYLVTVNGTKYPFRAFWNGKFFADGWSKCEVIAWRPLPEPYRSANKTEASDWRKDMLRKFDRRD